MADRFPLVVNNTTNQITEVLSGDNLLFDNTQLITSTGNLVLNPAGLIDLQDDIVNTVGANVKVDDDFFVTETIGIGTAPVTSTDLKIGRTWNDAGVTFIGIDLNFIPTASAAGSKALRLLNSTVEKFSVDVDGNTNIEGTLNVEGATVIDDTLNVTGSVDLDSTLNVDGNTTLVGTLGVTGGTTLSTLSVTNTLGVTGVATFSSAIDANSTLNVQGTATFQDGIYPDTDEGATIGSSALPWSQAHIGEIQIANGTTGNNDNTITTATGNLYLDSAGGSVTVEDNLVINGLITATSTGQDNNFRLVSTDSGAPAGPDLVLWRNSSTPADNDNIGAIRFSGNDDGGNETLYGRIYAISTDVTNTTEDGKLIFDVISGGANTEAMSITGDGVTIEGNLTVNGTQTILDTTTVRIEDNTLELRKGNSITGADGGLRINRTTDANGTVLTYNQLTWDESETRWRSYDGTDYDSFVTSSKNSDITGTLTVHSMLEDAQYVTGTAPTGTLNFDARGHNVLWHALNSTGDVVINFRADNSETLNNMMGVTEILTATVVLNNGATPYKITNVTVDGSTPTATRWLNGGSFPSGNANGTDVYVFTIIKTGSAAFTVLASQTSFS